VAQTGTAQIASSNLVGDRIAKHSSQNYQCQLCSADLSFAVAARNLNLILFRGAESQLIFF
jgi:hypothetical protein